MPEIVREIVEPFQAVAVKFDRRCLPTLGKVGLIFNQLMELPSELKIEGLDANQWDIQVSTYHRNLYRAIDELVLFSRDHSQLDRFSECIRDAATSAISICRMIDPKEPSECLVGDVKRLSTTISLMLLGKKNSKPHAIKDIRDQFEKVIKDSPGLLRICLRAISFEPLLLIGEKESHEAARSCLTRMKHRLAAMIEAPELMLKVTSSATNS